MTLDVRKQVPPGIELEWPASSTAVVNCAYCSMPNTSPHVLNPCGHRVCSTCAAMTKANPRCPVCKGEIDQTVLDVSAVARIKLDAMASCGKCQWTGNFDAALNHSCGCAVLNNKEPFTTYLYWDLDNVHPPSGEMVHYYISIIKKLENKGFIFDRFWVRPAVYFRSGSNSEQQAEEISSTSQKLRITVKPANQKPESSDRLIEGDIRKMIAECQVSKRPAKVVLVSSDTGYVADLIQCESENIATCVIHDAKKGSQNEIVFQYQATLCLNLTDCLFGETAAADESDLTPPTRELPPPQEPPQERTPPREEKQTVLPPAAPVAKKVQPQQARPNPPSPPSQVPPAKNTEPPAYNTAPSTVAAPVKPASAPIGPASQTVNHTKPAAAPPSAETLAKQPTLEEAVAAKTAKAETRNPPQAAVAPTRPSYLKDDLTVIDGMPHAVADLVRNRGFELAQEGTKSPHICDLKVTHAVSTCEFIHVTTPEVVKPSTPTAPGKAWGASAVSPAKIVAAAASPQEGKQQATTAAATTCTVVATSKGSSKEKYFTVEGDLVPESRLIRNQAVEYLEKFPHAKGKKCTNMRTHDAKECTYIHFKKVKR